MTGVACSAVRRRCTVSSTESPFRPSATHLTECRDAAERLGELKAREEDRDGLNVFADEILKAVELLKSLEWEDIRVERFNMTQKKSIVKQIESNKHRRLIGIFDMRRKCDWNCSF